MRIPSRDIATSAHAALADSHSKKRRPSNQEYENFQDDKDYKNKDYKVMFQALLDEKKRNVKNTQALIEEMRGLREEIKQLK